LCRGFYCFRIYPIASSIYLKWAEQLLHLELLAQRWRRRKKQLRVLCMSALSKMKLNDNLNDKLDSNEDDILEKEIRSWKASNML